jgi:hypothetical protein
MKLQARFNLDANAATKIVKKAKTSTDTRSDAKRTKEDLARDIIAPHIRAIEQAGFKDLAARIRSASINEMAAIGSKISAENYNKGGGYNQALHAAINTLTSFKGASLAQLEEQAGTRWDADNEDVLEYKPLKGRALMATGRADADLIMVRDRLDKLAEGVHRTIKRTDVLRGDALVSGPDLTGEQDYDKIARGYEEQAKESEAKAEKAGADAKMRSYWLSSARSARKWAAEARAKIGQNDDKELDIAAGVGKDEEVEQKEEKRKDAALETVTWNRDKVIAKNGQAQRFTTRATAEAKAREVGGKVIETGSDHLFHVSLNYSRKDARYDSMTPVALAQAVKRGDSAALKEVEKRAKK